MQFPIGLLPETVSSLIKFASKSSYCLVNQDRQGFDSIPPSTNPSPEPHEAMSTNDKLVTDGEKQDEPQAFEEGTESGADTCEGAIKDQVDAAQRELMDLVKRAKETKNQ